MSDAAESFVETLIPEGALVTSLTAVVSFLDPATGANRWSCFSRSSLPLSSTLGLLDLAKLDVVARSDSGLPFRYEDNG